jgi:hypothetical protein
VCGHERESEGDKVERAERHVEQREDEADQSKYGEHGNSSCVLTPVEDAYAGLVWLHDAPQSSA